MDLPKIAALYEGDIPDKNKFPNPLEQFFNIFAPDWLNVNSDLQNLYKYDALIMRSKWGGILKDESVNLDSFNGIWNTKFQIATFSISKSRIKLNNDNKKVDIINAEYGNLDSTAELAIWMAITLRRKLHLHCMSLAHGYWKNENITVGSGLKGTKWAIIGIGKLGSRILARLPGLGVSQIKAYYEPDYEKIEEELKNEGRQDVQEKIKEKIEKNFIDFIERADLKFKKPKLKSQTSYETDVPGNPGYDNKGSPIATKKNVNIEVNTDLDYVISDVDVVCLALVYTPAGKRRSTESKIKKEHFEKLQENAIFINVARAEIIDKGAYESIFKENEYGEYHLTLKNKFGFGSDVIEENCEGKPYQIDRKFQSHRIWAAFSSSMLNASASIVPQLPSILLTQHMGGTTSESEEMIAEEVIGKLLKNLGVREIYEAFFKSTTLPNQERIVLDADEIFMCSELMRIGYNLSHDIVKFIDILAEDVLFDYNNDKDTQIILCKKNGDSYVLPFKWKFIWSDNINIHYEEKPALTTFKINELPIVKNKEETLNIDILIKEKTYCILCKYLIKGNSSAPMNEWIRFALRVFYNIAMLCKSEDRNDKWSLQKRNNSLGELKNINWEFFKNISIEKKRPPN